MVWLHVWLFVADEKLVWKFKINFLTEEYHNTIFQIEGTIMTLAMFVAITQKQLC